MNFWFMQLLPGETKELSRNDVLDLVKQNVIGLGKALKGRERLFLGKFNKQMLIGDVVLIIHNGPLCLVQVTSNSFENINRPEIDFRFCFCREVKILAIDLDNIVKNEYIKKFETDWNESLNLSRPMDTANFCQFIRYWYDSVLQEKSKKHLTESSIYTVNEILQQDFSITRILKTYKWEKTQIEQLLIDLYNHIQNENAKSQYRLGSLTLCIDRSIRNDLLLNDFTIDIVDGKQRIITLLLILSILNPNYSNFLKDQLEYNRSSDYKNICNSKTIIINWIKEKKLSDNECIELFKFINYECELEQNIVYNISEAIQIQK